MTVPPPGEALRQFLAFTEIMPAVTHVAAPAAPTDEVLTVGRAAGAGVFASGAAITSADAGRGVEAAPAPLPRAA